MICRRQITFYIMIVSNFSKSLFCFLCVHDCGETAPFFLEDFSRHELRTFFRNDRLEFHVRENILLNVNTRSYLDQLETFCAGLKDASFRNIQSRLTVLDCLRSVISDLLGLLYELLELTFLIDDELSVFDVLFQTLGSERTDEACLLRACSDVCKSADAQSYAIQSGYVDRTVLLSFGKTERTEVKTRTVEPVEVILLICRACLLYTSRCV